ncbi:MAG: DinB family protein [Planctomycetota bacterium]
MDSKLDYPRPENLLAMRDAVLGQMQFAREYTLNLISAVPEDLWNVSPTGIPTHFAWQIGHLAVAQYGLMLFRQRGRAEADLELMPGWLRKRYSRGSTPTLESPETTSRDELLEILRKIHVASLAYVRDMPADVLAEPTEMPFTAYPIKLGALLFCPLHESIHSGQIGLLRRAHGLDPVR